MQTFVIAKMLVFNPEGQLLALRRSNDDERRPNQWDLPGGWVEKNENPFVAAKRETLEEAGVAIGDCQLVYAFSEPSDKDHSASWLTFLAHLDQTPQVNLSHEHSEYGWLTLDQAIKDFEYERQRRMLLYVRDNNLV